MTVDNLWMSFEAVAHGSKSLAGRRGRHRSGPDSLFATIPYVYVFVKQLIKIYSKGSRYETFYHDVSQVPLTGLPTKLG